MGTVAPHRNKSKSADTRARIKDRVIARCSRLTWVTDTDDCVNLTGRTLSQPSGLSPTLDEKAGEEASRDGFDVRLIGLCARKEDAREIELFCE